MTQHYCTWDSNYPENPSRFTSVINRCNELRLIERCKELQPRLATKDEILTVHTEKHYDLLASTNDCTDEDQLEDLSSHYDAIYMNASTFNLSLLACGSTIELVDNILDGKVQNGMAIIRPPGHHAMKAEFNGYCFFNNVAVAAKHALDNKGIKKILIVDWVRREREAKFEALIEILHSQGCSFGPGHAARILRRPTGDLLFDSSLRARHFLAEFARIRL
jgi:histone deacetylase 6